jgi:hypothetical protein
LLTAIAIQMVAGGCIGQVERRYPPTSVADRLPEWRVGEVTIDVIQTATIRSGLNLSAEVSAVPGGIDAAEQGWPDGAVPEPRQCLHVDAGAGCCLRRQNR